MNGTSTNLKQYSSKEGANPAQLVIQYTPAAAPASLTAMAGDGQTATVGTALRDATRGQGARRLVPAGRRRQRHLQRAGERGECGIRRWPQNRHRHDWRKRRRDGAPAGGQCDGRRLPGERVDQWRLVAGDVQPHEHSGCSAVDTDRGRRRRLLRPLRRSDRQLRLRDCPDRPHEPGDRQLRQVRRVRAQRRARSRPSCGSGPRRPARPPTRCTRWPTAAGPRAVSSFTNKPAFGALAATSGPTTAGTWMDLDVTGAVAGNGFVTLGFTTGSTAGKNFGSREDAAHAPQLLLTAAAAGKRRPRDRGGRRHRLQPRGRELQRWRRDRNGLPREGHVRSRALAQSARGHHARRRAVQQRQADRLPDVLRPDVGTLQGHHASGDRQSRIRPDGRERLLQLLRRQCHAARARLQVELQGLVQLHGRELAHHHAQHRMRPPTTTTAWPAASRISGSRANSRAQTPPASASS